MIDAARNLQWQYPSAAMPPPPGGFYFPDDAFFFHKGTGIISNQEENHTIVEIGYPSGKILWQYGHPGQPGSAPGYLNQPDDAYLLKNGDITVADAHERPDPVPLARRDPDLSQIGTNGVAVHNPPTGVGYPNGDTPLANGNVLVSEINGSWITEYTPGGPAGVDRAPSDRQLPLRPPAARPEPLPPGRLRPTRRGTHPDHPPLGRHRLDVRRHCPGTAC